MGQGSQWAGAKARRPASGTPDTMSEPDLASV